MVLDGTLAPAFADREAAEDLVAILDVPLPVVLLTTLQAVVHRLTDQNEVTASLGGVPSGIVTADFSDSISFADAVRRSAAGLAERAIGPPTHGLSVDGAAVEAPVVLAVTTSDGLLSGWVRGLDNEAGSQLAGLFARMLRAAAGAPDRPVRDLVLVADDERHRLLVEWNRTGRDYPLHNAVHELFAEQASRTPDAIAVVARAGWLTYRDLDERSSRLANHLVRLGVGPGVLTCICVERGPDMVVGLLGILKAGGAYVPLDATYPAERIGFMLENSAAPVLVTQHTLLGGLPENAAVTVCLDRDWPVIAGLPAEPPATGKGLDPDELAYVIYTSGSTGRPKGVQLPHRALTNFLFTMAERPGLSADDVLVAVTTLSFDIAALELFLPLIKGAQVVIASRDDATDPRQLAALLDEAGATVLQATPATWRMLVESGWEGRPGLVALCGGEPLPVSLAEGLLQRGIDLWNMYGPTETTVYSTGDHVLPGDSITIGTPVANTTVYVLDRNLQPVPVGVAGELHIGGHGLARGYLHLDELTAERFVAHPFDPTPGARIYKTGDLARWRSDGRIEHLGRLDHQVKVRGFRIELGEIETVLGRHQAVRSAVAMAHDGDGDPQLVAYAVLCTEDGGSAASPAELRRHLAASLPAYMVPASVVLLDALPLTPNGKVDRKALPAPRPGEGYDDSERVPPRNDLERRIVAIWESVLNLAPIGVTDDVFDLGVSSVVAARLFARVEQELGLDLPLAPLFQAPTVEKLAALLGAGSERSHGETLVAIQPEGDGIPFFCVHGGAGTILHLQPLARRLGPGRPFYAFQMRGLYGDAAPDLSVKAMAKRYITELRRIRPHGPYLLGGYCFGGNVAYEMARLLVADGEEVPVLAMFNSAAPNYVRKHGTISDRKTGPRAQPLVQHPTMSERAKALARWFVHGRRWQARLYGRVALRRPLPEYMRNRAFTWICSRAEMRYEPGRYGGEILQLRGEGLFEGDDTLGWGGAAASIIDRVVPGEHFNQRTAMQEPFVGFVAEELAGRIARAVVD